VSRRPPLRHRVEYGAYRVARWLWSALPEGVAVRFGALAGWLAGTVLRIRRREVDEHLALAFPDESPAWRHRIARRSYAHLGREAAILARMPSWSPEGLAERIRFVDFEQVRAAADQERGVVVLTAHLGNWEVAGAGLAALGLPLDVVGKGMANRRFERDLFGLRERLGMRVIEMSEAPRGVLRSLGRGRVAALLGDQNAHKHGLFLPFFGREAATPRGPALFALRSGAPVFVGFAIRDPGWGHTYTLVAHRLDHEVTGETEEDMRSLLSAYHRLLEKAIRAAPEQYFWQHKRWKTRPAHEARRGG
jgi:Kdo2-lipid IVA lauroyltransferase/acyltransferase